MAKKKAALTPEQCLQEALVPSVEQPYQLPENWCWTHMGNIAQWGSGGTPSRKVEEYYIGNIPWIKTGELNDGYIFETEEHITQSAIDHSSAKIFPINTVAIAMYGATIGKVGILGVEATTNQACACAIANATTDFKYLFYYALSQKEAFIDKGKGGAQPNISQEIIKNHPFPLPPLPEQQRIVERIDSLFTRLDEAKEKAQAALDSFEPRKAAILHKAFTGELTAKWREEQGVGMESWQNTQLKTVIQLLSGQDFSPDKYNACGEGIPYITGASNFEGDHVLINRWTSQPTVIAKKEDILLVCKGSGFGKTIIADFDEAHIARQIMALRVSDSIVQRFLLYFLRNNIKYIKKHGKGLIPGISRKVILDMEISLPSIINQLEIVHILDSLLAKEQQAKEASETVLEQIDLTKKAILSQAFRGELGTNDPTEESAAELLKEIL